MGSFFTYLTTPGPIGSLGWIFFIGQILGVAAGAYLVWVHIERNAARAAFARQIGITLMIVGGVGVLLGLLRLLNLPIFSQHLWFYVQLLIELGVAGYVLYYLRSVLPGLERQQASRRGPTGRTAVNPRTLTNVELAPPTPRPVPTTTRRSARRDRKRRDK